MAVAVESVVGAEQYPSPPAAITPWAMMENEKSAHGGCASSQRRTFSGEIPVMAGLMEKISNLASAGKIKLRYQLFFWVRPVLEKNVRYHRRARRLRWQGRNEEAV